MIRISLRAVAIIAVPLSLIAMTGSIAGAKAATPVNAATATATCTGITGTAKFSPKLTSSGAAVTRTTSLKGKLSGCTSSDGVSITSAAISGSFTRNVPASTNGCAGTQGVLDVTGSFTIKWKTTPKLSSGNTVITVSSATSGLNSAAHVGIAVPAPTGAPSSGTGSFNGSDHGAADSTAVETVLPAVGAGSVLVQCQSKKGVSSVAIQSPSSGNALSLG